MLNIDFSFLLAPALRRKKASDYYQAEEIKMTTQCSSGGIEF